MSLHSHRPRYLAAACALAALFVVEGSASGGTQGARTARVRLAVEDKDARRLTMCGKERPATVASQNEALEAAVRITRTRAIRRARVVIAECTDGEWRRVGSQAFAPSRRYRLPLDTSLPGDYRLRAVATDRRGRTHRSSFAYLRVNSPTTLTARIETSDPGAGTTYSPLAPVYAHPGQTMLRGDVSSPATDCVSDRRLDVYRTDGGSERQVASARTYPNGEYEIDLGPTSQPASGSYYVHAPARETCAEGRSPVVSGG